MSDSIKLKVLEINKLIEQFPQERKIDLCQNCRERNGDFKDCNVFLTDTNICSICFKTADLANYSIIELVEKSGLTPNEYYANQGIRTSYSHNEGMERRKNNDFKKQ